VWDLGANTGRFSRIAASAGAQVVAWEMDPSAVELNWREVDSNGEESVLPLLVDLSNPTPGQGWAHTERGAMADRGPADVALALALIHHIAIGNNVPLPAVAEWFATLARRLVIEWVPKDDPMVQRLLASRVDVFDDYTQDNFEAAIGEHFTIERTESVRSSQRTLYVAAAKQR
jgi:ribosomal protein L11 methylase PrmA